MDAAYEGGWFVTPPVQFEGKGLVLNINASAAGCTRVALLDAAGQGLPGYAIEDCEDIMTNDVAHVVTWRGLSDIGGQAGKTVRLRFEMRSAKLFAFQFQ